MRTQAAATTAPRSTYHQGQEKAGAGGSLTVRGHGGQVMAEVLNLVPWDPRGWCGRESGSMERDVDVFDKESDGCIHVIRGNWAGWSVQ